MHPTACRAQDLVLQPRCRYIDPDQLQHLEHDCEVQMYQCAKARMGFPADEAAFFLLPAFFHRQYNLETNPLRTESVT